MKLTGLKILFRTAWLPVPDLAAKPQGAGISLKIPVVVHILYHQSEENISDEKVFSQIRILNESFRRLNADTVNTPDAFKINCC